MTEDAGFVEGNPAFRVNISRDIRSFQHGVVQCRHARIQAAEFFHRTRKSVVQAIDKLKYEKAAMRADEYKSKLSQLLLELAQVQEDLDK